MYEYIKGNKVSLTQDMVVIDVGGIGYLLHISLTTHNEIKEQDRPSLFVHLYVREDQMELFGFSSEVERNMFRLLIGVSGVGIHTARLILSACSPSEIQQAILSENIEVFKSVKGIGSKTAKRIILDLKDKVFKEYGMSIPEKSGMAQIDTDEAFNALVALGFQRQRIRKALNEILKKGESGTTTEKLVKSALKIMTGPK